MFFFLFQIKLLCLQKTGQHNLCRHLSNFWMFLVGMGTFAFLVKEAWPWAVNSSGAVERTQWKCIKNIKRDSKLFLDLTTFSGMWEEEQQGCLVESTMSCLSLSSSCSIFLFVKWSFFFLIIILLFSCLCSPGYTDSFPLPMVEC